MRALALLLALSTPAFAQTEDLLPLFTHDEAITCMAYSVVEVEWNGLSDPARFATQMVFFSRLIAAKATASDRAAFDARFAERLALMRGLHAEMDDPAKRDEADDILTGTGKMCWYQALAAEGGPFAED